MNPHDDFEKQFRESQQLFRISFFAFVFTLILCLFARSCHAADWDLVEKTIIGEAANQGYDGMLAVAEVMRNRNWNLKGFCASRRPDLDAFVKRQGPRVQAAAHRALEAARAGSNTVHGADSYENIKAFGTPRWAVGHEAVATVGNHVFWKIRTR